MGARHSKRSMDVTTTPKKEGLPAEGGDAAPVGEGKLERIEEADVKPTTNGVGAHTEASEDKDAKDKDATTEKEETKDDEEAKVEETKAETPAETPAEVGDATTPTEGTPASPTSATSPDTKESKKKEKTKKKWSFRTISFGKKDKTKPVREDAPKNGDVSKEPLTEGGEEAEASPAEEKSTPASPTEAVTSAEPVESATPEAPAAESDDKNEASSTPAPTPVPLEAPKDDEKADKKPEVSQVQAAIVEPMVEVTTKSKPMVTASIIERKTSEDFPSHLPSSPPPTPIDPSPLQQAQQSAAHANQLAEALKLPAVSIVQSQCDNDSNKDDDIVNTDIKQSETIKSSTENDKELVVMSEEGPVPVTPVDEVSCVQEEPQEPEETQPEPEVVEEIVIEEVNQVEENVPVEEVQVEAIEEPEVLVSLPPSPPPTDDIEIVEEMEVKEEIPPPLPESPIPVPKASSELLNFMSSQISDTPPLSSIIDCSAVPQETDSPQDKLVKTDETELTVTDVINDTDTPQAIDSQCVDDLPPPVDDKTENKHDNLLTPPRSPSPTSIPSLTDESSIVKDNNIINDDRTETINNLNCHNNVIDKEDRLADNNVDMVQCPLYNADIVNKDQSIAEPEAPVEKTNEVTTEKVEEAPKSPPPSVPTEVSAPAAPVITEDVASVTKAIEEIDINEKAVAAAVNENIESVNTNEIIADMNHQNTLNE